MTICKKDIYEIIAKLLNVDDEMIKNIKEDDDLMLHGMTSISCIQLLVNIKKKNMGLILKMRIYLSRNSIH